MKKMKKFYMSLLSLAMCGAIGLSAGCNTPGGDSIPNSGNNPASDSNGNQSVKVEKKDVYQDVAESIETMATSGETYKLSFDLDATVTDRQPIQTESGYEEISQDLVVEYSGDMWFRIVEGNLSVDAVANAHTPNEGVEKPYVYMAAYIRSETDDVYTSMLESAGKITQAQIDGMEYELSSFSKLMSQIMGGGAVAGGVAELDVEPTDSTAIPEDTEATMKEVISAMVMRVAGGFFDGINGEVTVEGTVHTLSVDVKAELDSIYSTLSALVNLIDENTTINDLLASDTLKNFFTKYFKALTVEDLNAILTVASHIEGLESYVEGVVFKGETAYDAIVNFVKTMPAGDTANPDAKIGDMPIGKMKGQILEMLEDFKTKVLDWINSLKYSISVNDGMLSGVTVDVEIKNMMDLNVAVTFVEAEYTFVDVSGLTLVEAVE